jgi:hypothetical protein
VPPCQDNPTHAGYFGSLNLGFITRSFSNYT